MGPRTDRYMETMLVILFTAMVVLVVGLIIGMGAWAAHEFWGFLHGA